MNQHKQSSTLDLGRGLDLDEWSEDGKREFARAAWNNPANRPTEESHRG